jgi:starvation-inducible DNA-binding protein
MTVTTHDSLLGEQAHATVGRDLQATLVELIALSLIGKQLHWNIFGPGFRDLHLQLDEFVDAWRELLDEVAEREVAIGVSPDGSGPAALASGVASVELGQIEITEAVNILASRIGDVARRVRSRLERLGELDLGSQDVLIGVGRTLEQQLWMLRAQLPVETKLLRH